MTIYAVTRKTDGVEVYRYEASAPVEWSGFEFATHNHVAQPAEPPTPPVVHPPITKLAFRARFTSTEKITIELASLDVPDGSLLARQAAAQMRVWLEDIDAATFIDLNYAPTRAGVQALEDYGLIGAGRAAEVLDTAPTASEVWNG